MTEQQRKGAPALAILAVFTAFTALAAGTARADNKLFPTDVLDAKQIDVSANLGITEGKGSNYVKEDPSFNGRSKFLSRSAEVGARFGVGNATHIETTLNYASLSGSASATGMADVSVHSSGIQGMSLTLVHGFLPKGSAFTLAGALRAQNQTERGLDHEASNTYTAGLAAGLDLGSGFKAFSTVRLSYPEHGNLAKTRSIDVGAWLPVDSSITLVPKLAYQYELSTKAMPSFGAWILGLKAHLEIDKNSYLTPELGFRRGVGQDIVQPNYTLHENPGHGRFATISFYHLY